MGFFLLAYISAIFYDNWMKFFLFFIHFSLTFQIFFPILISTYHFWVFGPSPYPTLPGFCPKTNFSITYTFHTWFESPLKMEHFGSYHDSPSCRIKKLCPKNEKRIDLFLYLDFRFLAFFYFSHIWPIDKYKYL